MTDLQPKHNIHSTQNGFTLIEVLVVMIIFSVISVMTYQGFASLVDANERSKKHVSEQSQIQQTWAILLNDFMQIAPRPPRDVLGKHQRAYDVNIPEYSVRFTRSGLMPYGRQGGLQLIAYSVSANGNLLRWVWPVLDEAPGSKPVSQVLMTGVAAFDVEQLGLSGEYQTHWPPLNVSMALDALPTMIRASLTTQDGYKFQRIIPGVSPLDLSVDRIDAVTKRFPPIDATESTKGFAR